MPQRSSETFSSSRSPDAALDSAIDGLHVPPVFIVGCYRSGTSLLRLMLSAHSRVSISAEGAYMYRVGRNLPSYGDLSVRDNLERLHRDIVPFLEDERWTSVPSVEELADWVDCFDTSWRSIVTFYGTWEGRCAGKSPLAWWGDNAPYHVHEIPYFSALFPESKFIVMVRDPRDVYTSVKQNFKYAYPLDDVTALWEKALSDGLLAQSMLGRARVMTVRYERLVAEPRSHLEEICRFLGVTYEEGMLAFHDSDAARALSQIDHHRGVVQPVFSTSIGKFRDVLNGQEVDRIQQRLRLPMRCLGYLSEDEYEAAVLAASGLPRFGRDSTDP